MQLKTSQSKDFLLSRGEFPGSTDAAGDRVFERLLSRKRRLFFP